MTGYKPYFHSILKLERKKKKRRKRFYLDSSAYINYNWYRNDVYCQTHCNAIQKCATYFGSSEPTCVNIFIWILTRTYHTLNKIKFKVVLGEERDIFIIPISNCILLRSHYE